MKPLRSGISRRCFLSRAALLAAMARSPAGLFAQTIAQPRRKVILDVDHRHRRRFRSAARPLFAGHRLDRGSPPRSVIRHSRSRPATPLYIKERFGIDADVYAGAAEPLFHRKAEPPVFVHGEDGLGDVEESIAPTIRPASLSAPEFIVRAIMDDPGEITVITVGPVTNLMMARLLEPEIAGAVRDVVVMGGAVGFDGERRQHHHRRRGQRLAGSSCHGRVVQLRLAGDHGRTGRDLYARREHGPAVHRAATARSR